MPNVLLYSFHLLLSHAALTLLLLFLRPLLVVVVAVVVVAHAIIKIFLSNCFLFLFVRERERTQPGARHCPGGVEVGTGTITMSAASFVAPEP